MLKGILKGMMLSKLDDVFPGANQARDQLACCLTFLDYPESADLHTWVPPSTLNQQGFIAGKIKPKCKLQVPYRRGVAFFFINSKGKAGMV